MESTTQKLQKNPRLRRRWRIDLKAGDALVSSTFTKDVSAGGFCAELMRVPSPGTPVRGTIVISGNTFAFCGKVAGARPSDPGMNVRGSIGVTFTAITDDFKKMLI